MSDLLVEHCPTCGHDAGTLTDCKDRWHKRAHFFKEGGIVHPPRPHGQPGQPERTILIGPRASARPLFPRCEECGQPVLPPAKLDLRGDPTDQEVEEFAQRFKAAREERGLTLMPEDLSWLTTETSKPPPVWPVFATLAIFVAWSALMLTLGAVIW